MEELIMNNNLIIIELDKTRTLKYKHKALKMIEKLTGKSISNLDLSNVSTETIEQLLYAGLISEDKALKIEEMEDILDNCDKDYQYIMEKMVEAISKSFGGDQGKKQELATMAIERLEQVKNSTGTNP